MLDTEGRILDAHDGTIQRFHDDGPYYMHAVEYGLCQVRVSEWLCVCVFWGGGGRAGRAPHEAKEMPGGKSRSFVAPSPI